MRTGGSREHLWAEVLERDVSVVSATAVPAPSTPVDTYDRSCPCSSCVAGGICRARYGAVIPYESALQAPDQRLRALAQILAYVAATLAMARAVVTTVEPDGAIGTVVAWRPPTDAEARRDQYVGRLAATDLLAPARFAGTGRAVVSIADVGGPERFRRTPYGAFLAGLAIEAVGAMYLHHHGRIVACVGLLRELDAPQLSPEELAAVHRLHPLVETTYALSLGSRPLVTVDDLFDRAQLTARERDVVRVAALGARNAEIARTLYLSVSTVKIHLHHAFAKLGVNSRAALAARLQPIDTNDGHAVRAR